MTDLIEVVYTECRNDPDLVGAVRYLRPTEGVLYMDPAGTHRCSCDYEQVSPTRWRNRRGSVVEVRQPEQLKTDHETSGERGAGLKYDGGKPRWVLLTQGCHAALRRVVEVLTFGAKKYQAHSWHKVENGQERYRDALYRHLSAYEGGEVNDPESGLPHLAHVATNALFILELEERKNARP